jgi:hypothetical protein
MQMYAILRCILDLRQESDLAYIVHPYRAKVTSFLSRSVTQYFAHFIYLLVKFCSRTKDKIIIFLTTLNWRLFVKEMRLVFL